MARSNFYDKLSDLKDEYEGTIDLLQHEYLTDDIFKKASTNQKVLKLKNEILTHLQSVKKQYELIKSLEKQAREYSKKEEQEEKKRKQEENVFFAKLAKNFPKEPVDCTDLFGDRFEELGEELNDQKAKEHFGPGASDDKLHKLRDIYRERYDEHVYSDEMYKHAGFKKFAKSRLMG